MSFWLSINKFFKFWFSSVSVVITILEFVVLMVFYPLHWLTLPFWISITGLESALMLYASFWYNETSILHWVWSTIVISFTSRCFEGTDLISDSDNIIPLVLMTVFISALRISCMFENFVFGFRGLISISGFSVTIDLSVILISFGTVQNFWNDRYCSGIYQT